MSLITAGDYNVTYNQEYLLKRLEKIDILWSYVGLTIIIFIILAVLVYLFLAYKQARFCRLEAFKEEKDSGASKQFDTVIQEFATIASHMEDMVLINCIPPNEKRKTEEYLNYLVQQAMPNERLIYKYNQRTISLWFKYKYLLKEHDETKKN